MVKALFFRVEKIFDGEIKDGDLSLQEEELPELENGEYLVESVYLSIDPYQKAYARTFKIGQVMIGLQVAKVIQSKNAAYKIGDFLVANLGWRTHTIVRGTDDIVYKLPDTGNLSKSLALGVLGQTGATAYFGLLEICKPVDGDTVVVSGAAGAVGSTVGQIAKIKGCRVIGITGSEDKARWLESLGFDFVINYKKTKSLALDLKTGAPRGIDCYFDNVGGDISTTVMQGMNLGGRVAVCGAISGYNASIPLRANIVQPAIIQKSLTLRGFTSPQFKDRWLEAFAQNLKWIQENKLKYRETITDGFDKAPEALKGVLKGANTGKAIIRVTASHVQDESVDFNEALTKFKKIIR